MCFIHAVYQQANSMQSRELHEYLKKDLETLCSFVMVTTEPWAGPNKVGG